MSQSLTLFDKLLGGGLLAGKKTYLGAAGLAFAAAVSWLGGDLSLAELLMRLSEALGVAGLRAGMAKGVLAALAAAAASAAGSRNEAKPAPASPETGARMQAAWPSTIAAIGLALFLAGCGFTPQGDLARETLVTKGAQAADEGLVNAEWFVCQAATIGSVKRKYGVSRERADAYNRFCPDTSGAEIIGAPPADGPPTVGPPALD